MLQLRNRGTENGDPAIAANGATASGAPADAPARRLGPRELLIAGALMTLAVLLVLGDHILDGGFTLDDWSLWSDVVLNDGSVWDDVGALVDRPNISNRPLTGVLWGVGMNTLGLHMGWWLGFVALLGVWMAMTVYVILRLLGFGAGASFAVGALSVLTPVSDTLRLWIAAGTAQLPFTLALSGIALALLAFRTSDRRRALLLHGASVAAYASSLLFVETALVLMCGAILLYLFVAPPRAALCRWVVDVLVLGAIYVLITSQTSYIKLSTGDTIDHAWTIVDQARVLLTSQVLPFGATTWWALVPIVLLLAAGFAVFRSLPEAAPERAEIRRWLLAALGGVVATAAAYAPFSAAHPYYSPLTAGMGNRTNGLASVGWALLLVALVMLAATLAFRGLPRRRLFAGAFAGVLLAMVTWTYADRIRDDADAYQRSYSLASNTLKTMRDAVPDPAPGSMFYLSGQPLEVQLGIPVFNTTWDLDGAVKFAWREGGLRGVPMLPGLELNCTADAIVPTINGVEEAGFRSDYRKTYVIDGVTGQFVRIDNRKICRDASANWPRSPALPAA